MTAVMSCCTKLSVIVVSTVACAFITIISCDSGRTQCRKVIGKYQFHDNAVCFRNRQWYLHKSVGPVIGHRLRGTWRFAPQQMLASNFPLDVESRNYVREVRDALFSAVSPVPLRKRPKLAAVSYDVLTNLLDMDPAVVNASQFLELVNGQGSQMEVHPLAHRYGGHQFGYWSGQLGDGRAVMLGEYVNSAGERWELQLKGSGLTPYSRQGDGRAVIRSSVREFLCSEAMQALGIPTSRAASLVVSSDPVIRDQFYNGNIKKERAAVVLRLAKSWFRIGSFEILTKNGETDLLKKLTDFIILNYFPSINSSDSDRYLNLFQEIVSQTANLIALWQSVGFTHGVGNTDNFSILSVTIDYGPFGFMEGYDPNFVPNTSDDEGRYRYENQPSIGYFNLDKLRQALNPLLSKQQQRDMVQILKGYTDEYKVKFMELFLKKLGLTRQTIHNEDDEQMVAILLKMMQDTRADFTMTFRELSEVSLPSLTESLAGDKLSKDYWTLTVLSDHEWFADWVKLYAQRWSKERITDDAERQSVMQRVNPRYILRNWIAQTAIEHTEDDDFTIVKQIHDILKNPYEYNIEAEKSGFASRPPKWAKTLKVSCSS